MNKTIAILFAVSCFATSALSNSIMGPGMWFWIIIITGVFVALSQFFPKIRVFGAGIAGLLGIVSIFAVLLGLVAATIGGSFKLDTDEALLLFSFFLIAVFGITLVRVNRKPRE